LKHERDGLERLTKQENEIGGGGENYAPGGNYRSFFEGNEVGGAGRQKSILRNEVAPTPHNAFRQRLNLETAGGGPSAIHEKRALAASVDSKVKREEKPRAERSGGGVFGT